MGIRGISHPSSWQLESQELSLFLQPIKHLAAASVAFESAGAEVRIRLLRRLESRWSQSFPQIHFLPTPLRHDGI